jgi:DNA-binding MarR family transcriptional regulator
VIHSRIRLSVMSILSVAEEADFTYLKESVGATDGNLSTHLTKLEKSGYVHVRKTFKDKKPVSYYKITARGKKAMQDYVSTLEGMIGKA